MIVYICPVCPDTKYLTNIGRCIAGCGGQHPLVPTEDKEDSGDISAWENEGGA